MKYIIIIFLLIIIFYLFNIFFKKKEHMSMRNSRLNKIFNENGYTINSTNFTIIKDNDVIKNYSTVNFNNKESHKMAKNKSLSNLIFEKNNIPVPKHIIIDNSNKYHYLYDSNPVFPCVLKPINGMQGKDVNTFIKTIENFRIILEKLLEKYDKVMLENQVYGDNYRIFVFNNKVIDVIKREQPFVIGDGINNVLTLINNKNKDQKKNKLFATTNLDWEYIKEQGFNKESVLKINKKIFITNTINFHNGANPVRIALNEIPVINIDMFIKAHKLIGLECSGIDYMSPDIRIPYDKNDGHIIEINDMVDTKIHIDADHGKEPNLLFKNIYNTFV